MPWPLYLAFKQLFPTGRRFPFFTAISVLGVALGVMLIIVCMGVMGGFGFKIRQMIVDTQGEIQIVANPVADPAATMAAVSRVRGVTGITPFLQGFTMVEFDHRLQFPLLQGVDLDHVESVMPNLKTYIHDGRLGDLDDDSVILNQLVADSLHVGVGDTVSVYSPLMIERQGDEVILPRELRVVGIFEIGHQQLDSETVLVTLRLMQDLYGQPHKVQGFDVKLAPGEDVDAAVGRVREALPEAGFTVRSWEESFQDFLWILALEKNMLLLLLLCVELVASFMVMSLLLVLVIKKTREIGLLSALGGQPRQVALCFAAQGLFTGLVGTGLGLGFGFLILHFRNELVRGITTVIGGQEALVKFYQFQQLPAHLEHRDLAVTIVASLFLSTLAGLIPAWRAGRLNPVEALRGE